MNDTHLAVEARLTCEVPGWQGRFKGGIAARAKTTHKLDSDRLVS